MYHCVSWCYVISCSSSNPRLWLCSYGIDGTANFGTMIVTKNWSNMNCITWLDACESHAHLRFSFIFFLKRLSCFYDFQHSFSLHSIWPSRLIDPGFAAEFAFEKQAFNVLECQYSIQKSAKSHNINVEDIWTMHTCVDKLFKRGVPRTVYGPFFMVHGYRTLFW